MSCLECGERRRQWGAYCGPCFREVNGVVKVEAPPLVLAPPPKPPRPRANPRKVAATKLPAPPRMVRRCAWPGCDRKHELHGCCRRHAHRIGLMGAVGTDPATWEALWSDYRAELAALHSWNGRAHLGLPRVGPRPMLSMEQFRALVGR